MMIVESQPSHSSLRLGKPITRNCNVSRRRGRVNLIYKFHKEKQNNSLKYWVMNCEVMNFMHLNISFSNELELIKTLDFLYDKSKQGISFTGLLEAINHEVTITTAIHNIKSNSGSKTSGVDKVNINKYLQMPKEKLLGLVRKALSNYKPKPAKRIYISKQNGKLRPLGIPTMLDRIIQESIRIIIEPICEAKFYPNSYGFRPYRAQKHAITYVANIINTTCKGSHKVVWALEGDIKGCFDNINHRLLLGKLWKIGIHDKRIIKIIGLMLKAGYIENGIFYKGKVGTPQGGILSPLFANVYLNDFDWYVGRQYINPHTNGRTRGTVSRALRNHGTAPKYNVRFADDWVVLTTTEQEARRLKRKLTKYFLYRLKLELSEEKTRITDLRNEGIRFLGFKIKAETPRIMKTDKLYYVGKPFPDSERVAEKIKSICNKIRGIRKLSAENSRIAEIYLINSMIMGIAEYYKTSICSYAFKNIDKRVNDSAFAAWKRMYPDKYNEYQVPLSKLDNLPHRHQEYQRKTFSIPFEDKWIGITVALITHSKHEKMPFNQKVTPYTHEGRKLFEKYREKVLPLNRPSINSPKDIQMGIYEKGKLNFEYFMNREYAFNRDKGKCRCCGKSLVENPYRQCHHIDNKLPLDKVNKVSNLAWVCRNCHWMIHNSLIPETIETKVKNKIEKFRQKQK